MCGEFSAFPCSQARGDCAFCLPNSEGECSLPCSLG
ncbi:hypothetical protein T4B_1840, partial [Trichinella pseudospiralis]